MNPTEYVERPPAVTAVQWDGTDESKTWILDVLNGSSYDGELLTVRDSMDRDVELDRGSWVLRNDTTATVFQMSEADFGRRFQPAGA